jgi:PPK2 family polyphosphate:nucleotide phosphotransferase
MSYAHKIDGSKIISLSDFEADNNGGLSRDEGEARLEKLVEELTDLQELLYAASQMAVLIVLQGMDTSGKDGTIRLVTGPLNSQGCEVASFKVPTERELSHDFLWRIHQQTPQRGHIKIFNRSHYEDVLVVRVHHLVKEEVWKKRYAHINNFENLLADSRTIILKFFLHISKDEQEKRLLDREQDTEKFWKLSVGDWKEREHWNDYQAAYTEAINKCSSPSAPWFIVPANRKWFRNLAVAEEIVSALRPFRQQWLDSLSEVGKVEKARIDEFRRAREMP